jgi:8-oxo-dGTP diphosphatase
VEDAVRREAEEELSVKVEPTDILGVYSDPNRDPRGHIMSITFTARLSDGDVKVGDDASEIKWVKLDDIDKVKLAFDHSLIPTCCTYRLIIEYGSKVRKLFGPQNRIVLS